MSSSATVTIDLSDADKGLDAMGKRVQHLEDAFAEIKVEMKADQKDHREQEMGPDGKWAPRKLSTIASEKAHHKGRLVPRKILGKLATAVAYKSTSIGALAESRVKWSASQYDGGPVGRGVVLPSRPFLWISDRLAEKSADIIETKCFDAFGGR